MKNPFEGMSNKARALVAGVALAGGVHEGVQAQTSNDTTQIEQSASSENLAWTNAIPAWVETQLPFMVTSGDMTELESGILAKYTANLAGVTVSALPQSQKEVLANSLLAVMRTLKKLEKQSEGFYMRSPEFDTMLHACGVQGVIFESTPRATEWSATSLHKALAEYESVRSPEEALRFENTVVKDFGLHLEKALQEGPYSSSQAQVVLDALLALESKFETLENTFGIVRTPEYARLKSYLEGVSHTATRGASFVQAQKP